MENPYVKDELAEVLPLFECLRERRSCRKFTDRPVGEVLLQEILQQGLCAASGGNLQPFSIIAIRNRKTNAYLAEKCGQRFLSKVGVNLVFLLDWSRLKHYAQKQRAPFVAPQSFQHNLVAFADVVCAAQRIETAANLAGLGCCFIANILGSGEALRPVLHLPECSYPILLLSIGYPADGGEDRAKKLPYAAMVHREVYEEDYEATGHALDEKYEGMGLRLPSKEPYRTEQLDTFYQALLTSYSEEEARKIRDEAAESGWLNEMQRRFGLQYRAHESVGINRRIRKDLDGLGIGL